MTKLPRCSPLIAAAFAAVPRAAWSDGTPLSAVPVGATLYAADILHSERPDVFATLSAWTEAEQATYAAAAAYLAAGGSEETG